MPTAVHLVKNVAEGMPGPQHFRIERVAAPPVGDGILVELLCLSADPYMRGRMKGGPGGFVAGKPLLGYVAGRVIESKVDGWVAGDLLGAMLPYVTVQAISKAKLATTQIWKLSGLVEPSLISHGAVIEPRAAHFNGLARGDSVHLDRHRRSGNAWLDSLRWFDRHSQAWLGRTG